MMGIGYGCNSKYYAGTWRGTKLIPPSSGEMRFGEESSTDSAIPCLGPTSVCGKSARIDDAIETGSGKETEWLKTDN